jgi:hypothetical protein
MKLARQVIRMMMFVNDVNASQSFIRKGYKRLGKTTGICLTYAQLNDINSQLSDLLPPGFLVSILSIKQGIKAAVNNGINEMYVSGMGNGLNNNVKREMLNNLKYELNNGNGNSNSNSNSNSNNNVPIPPLPRGRTMTGKPRPSERRRATDLFLSPTRRTSRRAQSPNGRRALPMR